MPAKMKIRSAYSSLSAAERKVAEFILSDPERASLMVINEIANEAGVSVPSVTRLAKKLGYSGFLDFRVALASGNASISSLKSDPIDETDQDTQVVEKAFISYMRALEDTLKTIDRDKISELADKMCTAERIFIFGTSLSGILAQCHAFQLNTMGYDAISVTDPVVMEMYRSRFKQSDVFIGVSRCGRTKVVLDALKAAKSCGAYSAFISNFVNSPGARISDAFFCCAHADDIKGLVGKESNVSMHALFGTLLTLMARKKSMLSE